MTTSLYCDGIEEISFANGVVRLQLTQLRGNGSAPAGTLLVPLNMARAIAESLAGAAQQIEQQIAAQSSPIPAPTQAGADFLSTIPKLT